MFHKIEPHAPVIGLVISAGVAWIYLPQWSVALTNRGQDISNALGPIFDMATFLAGLLFAIYVLALSRAEGFLGRILTTKTFRRFHTYVSYAIISSIVLSIWTAVYLVIGMSDLSKGNSLIIGCMWIGMTVGTAISIGRVILIFLIIVGNKG